MFSDTYKTIETVYTATYKDKGSKFIAFVFPCFTEIEFKEKLAHYKKEFPDATHHCWAFRLGFDGGVYAMNGDGEPAYTAGKPIYHQLLSFEVCNVAAIVIRYFGGTLLGVSGLIQAYKESTQLTLSEAIFVNRTVFDEYNLTFPYSQLNAVMKILKQDELKFRDAIFDTICSGKAAIPKLKVNKLLPQLQKIDQLDIQYLRTLQ